MKESLKKRFTKRSRRVILLGAAAVSALLLIACGCEDEGDSYNDGKAEQSQVISSLQ
jgi:hypothetical protein